MPYVFVIGDSISMEYGPHLAALLGSGITYARKEGMDEAMANLDIPSGANGGDSRMVMAYLKERLREPAFTPDLLVLNAGLHDLRTDPKDGRHQIEIPDYRKNLEAMVTACAQRPIAVAWVRTTPIDDAMAMGHPGFSRCQADVEAYNAVADAVMTAARVPILDLHDFTLALGRNGRELWRDHAHFHAPICELQGAWLAGAINRMVTRRDCC